MAEFSLNIDEIENEVNDTLKKEQVKLENSNLKSLAAGDVPLLIHCGDFRYNYSNPEQLIPFFG